MTPDRISVWVLADQLSHEDNTALRRAPADAPVLMVESFLMAQRAPVSHVRLALIWSAMRHFARDLRRAGRTVDYQAVLPEPGPRDGHTFLDAVREHASRFGTRRLLVMTPSDWTMAQYLDEVQRRLGLPIEMTPNGLFMFDGRPSASDQRSGPRPLSPDGIARQLRRRLRVLVDDRGEPEGGQWHFEPEAQRPTVGELPRLARAAPDEITEGVFALLRERLPGRVGDLDAFLWPTTRAGALAWLEEFVERRLPLWGRFQDTVRDGVPVLAQSALSPLLNIGLLSPLEVVARAERAYHAGAAPLPAVAGFVRGVLGMREFVHATLWARMPELQGANFLEAHHPLPAFFWTGETRAACLRDVLRRALDLGWVSQTERLMILGNFLLLTGVEPRAACEWFGAVFADAWEWSVLPNVIGLALWADGGGHAPKPYAASANRISKISDHCSKCTYDHTQRHGPDACPFNFLYWNFLDRHRERLRPFPRMEKALHFLGERSREDLDQCARESVRFLGEIGMTR